MSLSGEFRCSSEHRSKINSRSDEELPILVFVFGAVLAGMHAKTKAKSRGRSRKSSCKPCCRCARVYRMEGIPSGRRLLFRGGLGPVYTDCRSASSSAGRWRYTETADMKRGLLFSSFYSLEITDWGTPLRELGLRGSVSVGELYG